MDYVIFFYLFLFVSFKGFEIILILNDLLFKIDKYIFNLSVLLIVYVI